MRTARLIPMQSAPATSSAAPTTARRPSSNTRRSVPLNCTSATSQMHCFDRRNAAAGEGRSRWRCAYHRAGRWEGGGRVRRFERSVWRRRTRRTEAGGVEAGGLGAHVDRNLRRLRLLGRGVGPRGRPRRRGGGGGECGAIKGNRARRRRCSCKRSSSRPGGSRRGRGLLPAGAAHDRRHPRGDADGRGGCAHGPRPGSEAGDRVDQPRVDTVPERDLNRAASQTREGQSEGLARRSV